MANDASIPYRPFDAGPFRWRLGLRPLDLDDWIEIDHRYDADVAEKRRVLAAHHDTAVAAIEPPDAALAESSEVLELLVEHLGRRFPERFGDLTVDEALGDGLHPIDAAGRLVQEDLALLVEREGQLIFGAGSICFPNRWDLRSKIGRTMDEVHQPVAQLNEQLQRPIDHFLDRLTAQRSFWRLGWGVLDSPALYQPVDGTAAPRRAQPTFADLHLRVERETLRRLPRTHAILFTIRTHLAPLGALSGDDAERLAAALSALPADVAAYKQLHELGPSAAMSLRTRSEV